MNTLQLIARAVGEKIAQVYARLKTHTAEENIHRTSAQIRAEITDADIPSSLARAEDVRRQLAGKVDNVPGKELMPSPGAQPRENHFLNEQGEYVRVEAGSVILDIQMDASTSTFTVSREQLSEYIERAIIGGEPGLNVYFKHQVSPFTYICYKVTDITFEYTTYWLTAYTNRQSEDDPEKDMVRHFTYSFIYDATQPEPLLPNKGMLIDSPYYITTYIDRALGGKADAGTVKTHLDNTAIHRTSAQIRAEITDADIPSSIARDAETDAKISVHNEAGNVHPGLRNSITNLENGTTAAGRSEYAQKLGDANGSYTKTQLDSRLSGLIRDVTYDSATAKFTFWFPDGRTIEIDTPLENTVRDGRYDTATASLVLVLVSGQEISIPAAGLTKIYTGKDTATAATTVNAAGEIAVALKQGTIDSVHLSSALQAAINSHLTLTGDTCNNITTFADQITEQPTRVNLASGDKHALLFGKIKRWFSDLGALAFLNKVGKTELDTALQGELNGKEPGFTKNTAFNKNFGTAAGTVCQGNDARLSDARVASDVYAWAKANAKPVYTANEVGAASVSIYTAPGGSSVDTIPYNLSNLTAFHLPGIEYCGIITIQDFIGTNLQLKLKDYAGDVSVLFRGGTTKSWKKLAFTSDIPASLPANGGDAHTVDGKHATDFVQTNARNTINGSLTIRDSAYSPLMIYSGAQPNPATIFVGYENDLVLRLHNEPTGVVADAGADVRINSNKFTWKGKQLATTDQLPTLMSLNAAPAVHTHDVLYSIDKRNVAPNTTGISSEKACRLFFRNIDTIISGVGMYADFLVFDTYGDATGGAVNALAFCKASHELVHVQAPWNNSSWTTAKRLAYKNDLTWNTIGDKPASFIPASHTHPKSQITDFPTNIVTTDTAQTISGAKTFTAYCDFRGGGGNSGSDMRFKKEVAPVENILTALLNLDVIQYTWDKSGETRRATFGLSASQLLEKGGVFGKIVHERGDEDATQWVEYDRVGVLALKGLQEIARKTEDENAILRQELKSLREEMTALREHMQSLKNMILR